MAAEIWGSVENSPLRLASPPKRNSVASPNDSFTTLTLLLRPERGAFRVITMSFRQRKEEARGRKDGPWLRGQHPTTTTIPPPTLSLSLAGSMFFLIETQKVNGVREGGGNRNLGSNGTSKGRGLDFDVVKTT